MRINSAHCYRQPFFLAPSAMATRISRSSAKVSWASELSFQVKKPKPSRAKAAMPATLAAAVPALDLRISASTSRSAAE